MEEVSHLRKEIMERFMPILDSANVKTSLEACTILNKHLNGSMKYGHTGLPFYPTIDETYCLGISQCEGLCNLGTFIMRACGVCAGVLGVFVVSAYKERGFRPIQKKWIVERTSCFVVCGTGI